ncbi:MAG: hypothetical protein KAI73_11145 [Rhodospirillaceae bacterium]|nr:hypothetical protein [Rhodospirillaceae bacterium]
MGREEEERKRQTGLETFRTQQEIKQEFAPEKERRIIKGADGRQYYADTGEPALPGVKTPQESFMDLMAPAPAPTVSGVPGAGLAGGTDVGLAAGTDVGEPLALEAPPQPQMGIREVFSALPQNIQAAIQMSPDPMKALSGYLLKSKGLEITTNPDGTVNISQGGPAGGWDKKATGTIQDKLINAREGLARISDIEQSFRPEFQQIGPRLGAAWSGIKETMGIDLDPTEQAQLADYSAFKMGAIENINRYIKEITGAQMSEAEAVRLRKGVPDPGDSPWSGDSPTVFDSKLKAQTRTLRSAAARYTYALNNGWNTTPSNLERAMPLNKVEDLIEERGTAFERQLRARRPDLSDTAIEGFVMQTLNSEFGMGQ